MSGRMTPELAAEFGAAGNETRTAGCDLLESSGEKVAKKNAFRKCLP
jgi:hypothetical protein